VSYVDLAVFKAYLRVPEDDTTDDVELQAALDTATSSINHVCSREFEAPAHQSDTRWFQPYYDTRGGRWVVPIDDANSVTAVMLWTEADSDWTTDAGNFTPRPIGANGWNTVFTSIVLPAGSYTPANGNWTGWQSDDNANYVQVEAFWGWREVPAAVQEACKLQASRVFKRRDAPFGVTSSPDGSENTRLGATLDVDVQVALRGYIKYWAAR
jgi:hypothetical protein